MLVLVTLGSSLAQPAAEQTCVLLAPCTLSQPATQPQEPFASSELKVCVCQILCYPLAQLEATGSSATWSCVLSGCRARLPRAWGILFRGMQGLLTPSLGKHLWVCCLFKGHRLTGVHCEESRWLWTQRCLVRGRCEDLESAWHRGAPSSSQGCHHMLSESSACHKEERLTLVFVASKERTRGTEGHSALWFDGGRAFQLLLNFPRRTGLSFF